MRFYDHAGQLLAARSPAGYRLYDDAVLARLRVIAAGKGLGLPLEEIRELLAVWEGHEQSHRVILAARGWTQAAEGHE